MAVNMKQIALKNMMTLMD